MKDPEDAINSALEERSWRKNEMGIEDVSNNEHAIHPYLKVLRGSVVVLRPLDLADQV